MRSFIGNCKFLSIPYSPLLFLRFFLFHSVLIQRFRLFYECTREYWPRTDRYAPRTSAR